MSINYSISGALDIHEAYEHVKQNTPEYLTFQEDLQKFKDLVVNLEKNKTGATFVHFGDGDYFFLKKVPVGSAEPGRRALSIPYDRFNIQPFIEGWQKNDYFCVEYLERPMRGRFHELFPHLETIATEFIYGLTMSRWFFKTFKGKIGLIGASEKLNLIQELMKRKEYQEYLGLESFNDYITIPQRFACDNLENTVNFVKEQLEKSNPETTVFLFGVGHVKSGLIHQLKSIKNAIYLDVGGGIDGIAGVIDPERPYALEWVNHRMKSYDYSRLDLLNYNISTDKNLKWIE